MKYRIRKIGTSGKDKIIEVETIYIIGDIQVEWIGYDMDKDKSIVITVDKSFIIKDKNSVCKKVK